MPIIIQYWVDWNLISCHPYQMDASFLFNSVDAAAAAAIHSDDNFYGSTLAFLHIICNHKMRSRHHFPVRTRPESLNKLYSSRYLTEKWISKRLSIISNNSHRCGEMAISFRMENRSARSPDGGWKAAWRISKVTLFVNPLTSVNQQSYWHFDIHKNSFFLVAKKTKSNHWKKKTTERALDAKNRSSSLSFISQMRNEKP